jgi:hypothetical protein
LRFTISYRNSICESILFSLVIPTRKLPEIGLELTFFPNIISFKSNLNTIYQKLLYNILKIYLDQEKLLKVRIPDLYYGKFLKK